MTFRSLLSVKFYAANYTKGQRGLNGNAIPPTTMRIPKSKLAVDDLDHSNRVGSRAETSKELINSLESILNSVQLSDLHRLQKKVRKFASSLEAPTKEESLTREFHQVFERLLEELKKSADKCQLRSKLIPEVQSYPSQLPVSAKACEIAELIRNNQVVVIAGDTGSGKTTQLPKICLDAGLGRRGMIGHTQPRRLAALSVATRIADELGPVAGRGVGSQVRFDDRSGPETYLKLMTDGILLAEIQADRYLSKYEAIIIDEAHERSLNIDFLLGFLRDLIRKRSDLKLIITSATIDVEKFSAHFCGAPIVSVEGRTFPVEVRYKPVLQPEESSRNDDAQTEAIISAIKEILQHDRYSNKNTGDILVFLPTEREIRDTATSLRKAKLGDLDVLPLYGRLQHAEQARIFAAHNTRRVVLATNVAETSITVPGINYVVDTGTARISRYSLQSKVQRLPIEAISQASANQRKGRCGRIANGICIRLYSEQDFDSRPLYTDPEIQRTNLAAVILRMLQLKLGDVENFPFIEMPETKAVNEGHKLLIELNAITASRALTSLGRQMAALPIDPRYARMLLESHKLNCLREVLIIVSGLSIQDPRESNSENKQIAIERQAEYKHPDSDFMSLVKLWDAYEALRQGSSQAVLRKYCKEHFLSFMRMREWREIHRQLLLACQGLGFRINDEEADYASIHKSLIAGSLNQIARKSDERSFVGTRNKKFSLFGASVLARSNTKWIITGDQIETSQVFATQAAKIQPEWVEEVAMHLVKRESFDPHWSRKRQEVMAYEKVHLFGLTLVERSLVRFAPIDPIAARALFIRHGLVDQQLSNDIGFVRHNQHLLERLEKLEDKLRRPDILASESTQIDFFERVIPDEVNSLRTLRNWLVSINDRRGDCLKLSEKDLLADQSDDFSFEDFPDAAAIQSNTLRIDYVFEPGKEHDGATIDVPVSLLAQLTQADIDWSVPGIIREKCIALLKGLPKAQRKNFIPVNAFVSELLPHLGAGSIDFLDSFISAIYHLRKFRIDRQQLEAIELRPHLKIKVRVLDNSGKQLAIDSSLDKLKRAFSQEEGASIKLSDTQKSLVHPLEVSGLVVMPKADLPLRVEVGEGNIKLLRYPGLVDAGDSVSVKLFADEDLARSAHARGVLKLVMLNSVQQRNMVRKRCDRFVKQNALKLPIPITDLVDQCVVACYDYAITNAHIVRDRQSFEKMAVEVKAQVVGLGDRLVSLLERIILIRLKLKKRLSALSSAPEYLLSDVNSQLDHLFTPNFVVESGIERLTDFPRYLNAIELRLAKAPFMGPKDKVDTELLANYSLQLEKLRSEPGIKLSANSAEKLEEIRWMLEEFRVSAFAQSLKTKIPVSPIRIEKALSTIKDTSNGVSH